VTTSGDNLPARCLVAQAIAREAGVLMRRRFENRDSVTFTFKGHQDYLTEVDSEVERLVRDALVTAYPHDGFIGEETGGRSTASVWVVDPIDGTANFARGAPHFCISMAFIRDGHVEIGVIFDPMLDEMFVARRGAGASLNGLPMRVASTPNIQAATIEVGWNMRGGVPAFVALVERVTATGAGVIRSGSGALGIAYVAAGRRDGYVEQHMQPWDALAALVMVTEAGGCTNDFLRNDGLTRGSAVIATTPILAGVLETVSGIAL
jgi:myo-inositol-1(or 4)-monophosphatase